VTIPKSPRVNGRDEIKAYCGRGWVTVRRWILLRGFPCRKIDGRWDGDCDLIDEWFRDQITKKDPCQGS